MDWNKIEILLEKYYEGLTDEGEERVLRDYFLSQDVPVEHQAEKETFLAMSDISAVEGPGKEFSQKLLQQIDNGFEEPKTIQITNLNKWIVGIAASLLIMISLTLLKPSQPEWQQDTYSNPDIAYEETRKVLHYVSSTMSKNTVTLNYIKSLNNDNSIHNQKNKIQHNEINPDNDLFINYISGKWPGVAGR